MIPTIEVKNLLCCSFLRRRGKMGVLKYVSKTGSPVGSAVFLLSKYWQPNLVNPF